jgi:tetratricopeptide (TPR) repeat protein
MWEVYSAGLPPHHVILSPDPPSTPSPLDQNTEAAVSLLLSHLHTQRPSEALHIANRLLLSSPLDADAWHLRGLALLQLAQASSPPLADSLLADSLKSIDHALSLSPAIAFYHHNRAEVLLQMGPGRFSDALSSLSTALRLDPLDLPAALRLQSLLLHRHKDPIGAMALYHKLEPGLSSALQSTDPSLAQLYLQQAVAAAGIGDYASAAAALRRATWLFPENHEAAMKLGSALEAMGQVDDAVTQYTHAVQLKTRVTFQPIRAWLREQGRDGDGEEEEEEGRGRERVAIYCEEYGQGWWGHWGPSSLGSGLGGSEEAVIFIAR